MLERKKVLVEHLVVGMCVVEPDRPWLETPFMVQDFVIKNQKQIDEIKGVCEYVYIDEYRSVLRDNDLSGIRNMSMSQADPLEIKQTKFQPNRKQYEVTTPFEEEVKLATKIYIKEKEIVNSIFDSIRDGAAIDTVAARAVVEEKVQSVLRNPNAMMWLTQLNNKDEYTVLHSLDVSTLAVIFGRFLGFDEESLTELAFGGLLHDIGKLKVPLEILNKPAKLTDEEFAVMRQHPDFALEILKQTEGIPQSAFDIAFCHHERNNGQGYPQGLRRDQLSLQVKIIAIVDTYDAITSDRVYQKGRASLDALKILQDLGDDLFDQELVNQFVKCIGIYPVGSIVEMSTEQVGIVVGVNPQRKLRPYVMLLLDENKKPYLPERFVDLNLLNEKRRSDDDSADKNIDEYYIKRILDPGSYDIDVQNYLDLSPKKAAVEPI